MTPPPAPRPRLAAALAGAGAALLFVGVARAWWGPDVPTLGAVALPAAGVAGALLPAARPLAPGLGVVAALAVALVLGVASGHLPGAAGASAVPLVALLAGGALAGAALARARGEVAGSVAALGGAALVSALRALTAGGGPLADSLLAPIGLCLLALAWRAGAPGRTRRRPSWRLAAGAALGAVAGAAVGLAAGVSALALAYDLARPAAAGLVVALAAGAWLGAQRPLRARPWVGGAALAAACASGLAGALAFTRFGATAGSETLLAGLAVGLALGPLRLARGACLPLWLGALAAVLVAPAAARLAAARLDEADGVALALGRGAPAPDELRRAVDDGQLRARFAAPGSPPVRVIDLRAGERAARVLYAGTTLLGAVPLDASAGRAPGRGAGALLAAPVLEGTLAHLLAPEAPRRVVVLGLDAGVSAGAALAASSVEELLVLEPAAGVVGAHRDPGDLFGAVNGRPLEDRRARLVEGPAWPALRGLAREPVDVLLAGGAGPAALAVARPAGRVLVVRVADAGGAAPADLRARVRDLLPALGPDVLAFWPHKDAPLLLVAGAGPLDPVRLAARWEEAGALRARLEALGVRHPTDVVGLCVAGPTGLLAFASGAGEGDGPLALARAAASSLPEALALPEDPGERAALLVRLAEEAGRRAAPTAGALARAALRAARTPETLRVLGDTLLQEGRADEARARWKEALALDPAAVAPRLSMAVLHAQQGEGEAARKVLEEALEGDPAKDAPVRYALGQLAMAQGDYERAREEFAAAGSLSDAADRAVLAGELARRGARSQRERPVDQRLATARLLVERTEAAIVDGDEEAASRHQAAGVAILLELADDPDALDGDARGQVGRLLARCAAVESVEAVRAHLWRRAAEVLAPVDRDPALAVERAVALHMAGRTGEAEGLLREVGATTGARAPRVHAALGDLLASTGRGDAAIQAYERALAVSPGSSSDASLYLAIASLHREAGRLDRAVRALEDADRLAPGHPDVLADLGALYRRQGRDGDALATWRRFLEVAGPRHPRRTRIAIEVRRLEAGR